MSENEITTQSLQEKEVDGKIYRIWNAAENLWHKLSFINKAKDTICDDGNNVETKLSDLNKSLDETKKSVADGKKLVATSISNQGVATASDATFQVMADNIGTVGTNKYDSGRTQGRSDVTSSPNSYSLYTKSQYDANYTNGYNSGAATGVKYKSGNYNTNMNGEMYQMTSFDTGLSSITAYQIRCCNNESMELDGRDNDYKVTSISGGRITLKFYAPNYCQNYVYWLAVGR